MSTDPQTASKRQPRAAAVVTVDAADSDHDEAAQETPFSYDTPHPAGVQSPPYALFTPTTDSTSKDYKREYQLLKQAYDIQHRRLERLKRENLKLKREQQLLEEERQRRERGERKTETKASSRQSHHDYDDDDDDDFFKSHTPTDTTTTRRRQQYRSTSSAFSPGTRVVTELSQSLELGVHHAELADIMDRVYYSERRQHSDTT